MRKHFYWLLALAFAGCAGVGRSCSSWSASSFGSDWIVIKRGCSGEPTDCWKLKDVSVANEEHSDGVYWKDENGHLVHISGWYDRVQVAGGGFDGAAKAVGVDLARCPGGKYLPEPASGATPPKVLAP
jgi:hypothetical protein